MMLLETVERYLSGAMLPEEKLYFERLKKNTPEIDQMVVEHKLFLHQMNVYAEHKNLTQQFHNTYNKLLESGQIYESNNMPRKDKVINLWHKYKKVISIAASIAGITALIISFLVAELTPVSHKSDIQELSKKINNLEQKTNVLNKEIQAHSKVPVGKTFNMGGTGFLIDPKGYIITNAHVLKGSGAIGVNNKNEEYNLKIVYIDPEKDLAILKINDEDYKAAHFQPFIIKKTNPSLGEEVYTLGYPRDEIVYNMGYVSAKTGFDGDTSSFQISLPANPGNSGGPVFNKYGEVVGILSTRETQAEGVVFAIKSKNIYTILNQLKQTDSTYQNIYITPYGKNLQNLVRTRQIEALQAGVFQIKAYN